MFNFPSSSSTLYASQQARQIDQWRGGNLRTQLLDVDEQYLNFQFEAFPMAKTPAQCQKDLTNFRKEMKNSIYDLQKKSPSLSQMKQAKIKFEKEIAKFKNKYQKFIDFNGNLDREVELMAFEFNLKLIGIKDQVIEREFQREYQATGLISPERLQQKDYESVVQKNSELIRDRNRENQKSTKQIYMLKQRLEQLSIRVDVLEKDNYRLKKMQEQKQRKLDLYKQLANSD